MFMRRKNCSSRCWDLCFFNSQICEFLQWLWRGQSSGKFSYPAFQNGELFFHYLNCYFKCVIKPLSDLNVCGISMYY